MTDTKMLTLRDATSARLDRATLQATDWGDQPGPGAVRLTMASGSKDSFQIVDIALTYVDAFRLRDFLNKAIGEE
jgi:hypothetical protein